MINATPSLPTASSQPPKDPTFGAKPAPMAMKPKAKTNWRMILGLGVLLLVIVGGAAGFYLTQQAGIGETRQQAAASCTTGQSYCASGSGTCTTGFTPTFDSTCPNQVRCRCQGGGSPRSCATVGATCTFSGSCAVNWSPISGDSCSDGTRDDGICCRQISLAICYDLQQGCARIEDSTPGDNQGCGEGPGGGKYTAIDLCRDQQTVQCCINGQTQSNVKRVDCRTQNGTEGACAAQQSRGCYDPNNCATSIQLIASVPCPNGMYDSATNTPANSRCAETVNCYYPTTNATQQTMRYRCLETNGIVYQGCPAGTHAVRSGNIIGCECNNEPELVLDDGTPASQVATLCRTGATPSPGTGGTVNYCPNPPNLPARRYVRFTCPNGCSLTTEGGVTDWRCYGENGGTRTDSTTPLSLNGECGQVDVLSGDTDATYCGYLETEYTCDQPRCQPQQTPPPSTPPAQASCVRLELLDETGSTVLNQTPASGNVRFRCVGAPGSNYYFFTARSNQTGPLNLIYQGDSSMTFPIAITDYLHVQCNPCIGTSCASAENVNTSCNFEYTRQIPPGPQCLALWMASTENPTVSLTNPHVGDSILLGCGQVQGAARYVFRVTEPDGNVVNLQPLDVTAAPRTSQAYTITKQGRHYAQCQICTGQADSTCFAYETLPSN